MLNESKSIGRNTPCPCGSGKKYKKCCMLRENNPAREAREELQQVMKDQVFDSLEDAQVFVKKHMEEKNSRPRDDFQGLSPYQMHRLLHFPFGSPDVVQFDFDSAVRVPEDVPFLKLLVLITDCLGEKGLKPTATGNLPRKVVREIAQRYFTKEKYTRLTKYGDLMSEKDMPDLNITRLTAKTAGFIRSYRGRILVTKECRKMVAASNWAGLYKKLFLTYIQKINWAYPNNFLEVPFFQQSFAVSLYFLQKFGSVPRNDAFYAERFITAFPILVNDIHDTEYMTAENQLKNAYSAQVLGVFAELTGCVKYEWNRENKVITVLPLLSRLVSFFVRG